MVIIFFVTAILAIFISTGIAVPPEIPNNNQRINEGASTLRDSTEVEKCEIQSYAEDAGRLLLAEDIEGENLADMMNNRFHELQAFHDQIYSYYVLAEYGAQGITNRSRSESRRIFFNQRILETLKEIFGKTCSEHFHYKLWYEYDREKDTIIGKENISFSLNSNGCLCSNYREQIVLSEPFHPPSILSPRPSYQLFFGGNKVSTTEVTQYHVIPLSLITRFFELWFSDKIEDIIEPRFNDCLFVLIGRLRRSILKLLIVKLRSSSTLSDEDWHRMNSDLLSNPNSNFLLELLRRGSNWMNGNIYLGPTNRGPLSPEFGRTEQPFDNNAQFIFDRLQHKRLLLLYHKLQRFIKDYSNTSSFDSLINGFDLFNLMTFVFSRFDITPMNNEQWEERYPYVEELRRFSKEMRDLLKSKKYWDIKKHYDRHPRSIDYYYYYEESEISERDLSSDPIKHVWSKFLE